MKSAYTAEFDFSKYLSEVKRADTIHYIGHVSAVNGLEIESFGPRSVIGEMCTIRIPSTKTEWLKLLDLREQL